jgi:hypothetical protein
MEASRVLAGSNLLDTIFVYDQLIQAVAKEDGVAFGRYVSEVLYPLSMGAENGNMKVPVPHFWFPKKGCINILRKLSLATNLHFTLADEIVQDTALVAINTASGTQLNFKIFASGIRLDKYAANDSLVATSIDTFMCVEEYCNNICLVP